MQNSQEVIYELYPYLFHLLKITSRFLLYFTLCGMEFKANEQFQIHWKQSCMVSYVTGEQLLLLKQKLSLPYVYWLLSYFKFIFSNFILLIISTASDFATRTSETELETFQCGACWEAQGWYDNYFSWRHLKSNRCRKNPSQGFPYLTKNSNF